MQFSSGIRIKRKIPADEFKHKPIVVGAVVSFSSLTLTFNRWGFLFAIESAI